MRVIFTKISDDRHRLEYRRADGGGEAVEMETRSFLLHDLAHFALESTAGIGNGVYGRLAAGETLADLSSPAAGYDADTQRLEQAVVVLQTATRQNLDLAETAARFERLPVPLETLEAANHLLRALTGRWKATPYGGLMELNFPIATI